MYFVSAITIGANKTMMIPEIIMERLAITPSNSCLCLARAIPMACAALPNAAPEAILFLNRIHNSRTSPNNMPTKPVITVNSGIKLMDPPTFSVSTKAKGIEIERANRLFFTMSSKFIRLAKNGTVANRDLSR